MEKGIEYDENGSCADYFLGPDPRKHKDFIRLGGDPKEYRGPSNE